MKFNSDKFEKCIVYFEEKEVHLQDGTVLPIHNMLTSLGIPTEDWREALFIQAGKGNDWVNLRLLDKDEDAPIVGN